jgi:hypothetical protein
MTEKLMRLLGTLAGAAIVFTALAVLTKVLFLALRWAFTW